MEELLVGGVPPLNETFKLPHGGVYHVSLPLTSFTFSPAKRKRGYPRSTRRDAPPLCIMFQSLF